MINLLPEKQKQMLLEEERFRLTLILGTLFLAFLLCLSLILFSIKNYTLWDLGAQTILIEEKERRLSLSQDMEKEIKEANLFLVNLISFYQSKVSTAKLMETIEATLPPGVYLTSLDFAMPVIKGKDNPRISLYGISPDRETLLTFQANLKNEESFSEVYFSPESWIEPVEPEFNVSFRINKDI